MSKKKFYSPFTREIDRVKKAIQKLGYKKYDEHYHQGEIKRVGKTSKNKAYIGTVSLYDKGKCYGATTRQVYAKNRKDAIKKLKKKFKFGRNVVKVTKLRQVKKDRI